MPNQELELQISFLHNTSVTDLTYSMIVCIVPVKSTNKLKMKWNEQMKKYQYKHLRINK